MEEKNTATLIAVGGVVALGIGTIVYYAVSGNPLDVEVIKQITAALMGFAAGISTMTIKDKV